MARLRKIIIEVKGDLAGKPVVNIEGYTEGVYGSAMDLTLFAEEVEINDMRGKPRYE